jgi:hypothetical protein
MPKSMNYYYICKLIAYARMNQRSPPQHTPIIMGKASYDTVVDEIPN